MSISRSLRDVFQYGYNAAQHELRAVCHQRQLSCLFMVSACRAETTVQKKMMARINDLFDRTTFFEASQFTRILLV